MIKQLCKGSLRFGLQQTKFYKAFDKNHLNKLMKAQQDYQNSKNLDDIIHYQIVLSFTYSNFPQYNDKICSHSLFYKIAAIQLSLDNQMEIDQYLIDQVTQENIHTKLVFQNYENKEYPPGYDQYYNDQLFIELLLVKSILAQQKLTNRYITIEEFKEWKSCISRIIDYKKQQNKSTSKIQLNQYFLQIEYFTNVQIQGQLTGVYNEDLDEFRKSLYIVEKAKKLVKQGDPYYSILLQYQARVSAYVANQLKFFDLQQSFKFADQALIIYEELNQQDDLEYIKIYKDFCQRFPYRYNLIYKTEKMYGHLKTLDRNYKDKRYQIITMTLFYQQVVINKTELENEIQNIIYLESEVLKIQEFELFHLISQQTKFSRQDIDFLRKKGITQVVQLLLLIAQYSSRNEFNLMSDQIKKANLDSKELESTIFLLNSLFLELILSICSQQ